MMLALDLRRRSVLFSDNLDERRQNKWHYDASALIIREFFVWHLDERTWVADVPSEWIRVLSW
jgi:hypothetical protein